MAFPARLLFASGLMLIASCGSCSDSSEPDDGVRLLKKLTDSSQLITGREAASRVGDYLFDNGTVRFAVQAPGGSGWGRFGGSLVDLDSSRSADTLAQADDRMQELFIQCDLRAFKPETVEIVSDGRNGTDAVLRFVGGDGGIPFLDAVLVKDPLGVEITLEYVLKPKASTIEINYTVKDILRQSSREMACGVVLLRGDELPIFIEGPGVDPEAAAGDQPYLAAAAWDSSVSYVLHRKDKPLDVILAQLEVVPIGGDSERLLASGTLSDSYYVSVGLKGDVDSALTEMRNYQNDTIERRPVEITVEVPASVGADKDAVVLTFLDQSKDEGRQAVNAAQTDSSGVALAHLEAGDYKVRLQLEGRLVEEFDLKVEKGAGAQQVKHALATNLVKLSFDITHQDLAGNDAGATPARLKLIRGLDKPASGGNYLSRYLAAKDRVFVPAGEYTVVLSRGPEYELFTQNMTLEAGKEGMVKGILKKVVDSSKWLSADLHVHSTKSADSDAPLRTRVLGAVSEGLDILVSTDHDIMIDYGPTAKALGVDNLLQTVIGAEISPLYGHMNAYPLAGNTLNTYWQPAWFVYDAEGRYDRALDPDELAKEAMAMGAEVVQLNHPRATQGVFKYIGLKTETGELKKPWPGAHVTELLNGKRLDNYPKVFADFVRLVKDQRRLTLVGTSDLHGEFGLGYARTYIKKASGKELWKNLRDGKAVVALGPLVELEAKSGANSAAVGDTLAASGQVQLDIRIQAPSWISVEELVLIQDGQVLQRRPITAADANPNQPAIRFQGTISATVAQDSYFMAEVRGTQRSAHLIDESRSITNPVFIDADGGGYTPPGN